jgi:hypothetical protein
MAISRNGILIKFAWCNAIEIRGEENWLDYSLLNMYIYGGHTLLAKGPNALERTSFAHYESRAYTISVL